MTQTSPAELYPQPSLDLADYQQFVASTRRPDEYNGAWQEAYAGFIASEQMEFLMQHGFGAMLLLPRGFEYPGPEPSDELRYRLADETGDLLWLGFDIADRMGLSTAELCTDSLREFTSADAAPITNFAELQDRIMRSAQKIKVINKIGLLFPEERAAHGHTTLSDDPNYLFMRATQRLCRSLEQGSHDMAPPTASELEPIQATPASTALYLLTLAYIAKDRLGVSIEDIARFNMAKLQHRQQFGKQYDLQFDSTFIRS